MENRARPTLIALALAFTLSAAFGSGYSIYEQGAAASGQSGAFTARASDASAIFYNPAGIVSLDKIHIDLGASAIFLGNTTFTASENDPVRGITAGDQFEMEHNTAVVPHIYFVHKAAPRIAWGVGVFANFGLKTEWDENFGGRDLSRLAELKTLTFNPVLAFEMGHGWSGAIGGDYTLAKVTLEQNINFGPFGEGFAKVDGDGDAWGMNVALRWHGAGPFYWGLTWRSKQTVDIPEGDARFTNIPPPFTFICGGSTCFPDGGASSKIVLPENATMGLGWTWEEFEAEVDVNWIKWSDFETLHIDFDSETPLLQDSTSEEDWSNTYAYRFGFSWHASPKQSIRAGAYWETNPIPDQNLRPSIPDSSRTGVSLGYGYNSGGLFKIDAYGLEVFADKNETNSQAEGLNGSYETKILLFGVTAGFTF